MTVVRCPYCGTKVVEEPAPEGSPLPRLRDGLIDPAGVALGVFPGRHQCAGLACAGRILAAAEADS